MAGYSTVKPTSVIVVSLGFFCGSTHLCWLLHSLCLLRGHMTGNNNTIFPPKVSMLEENAGRITQSLTSDGNSALLTAYRIYFHKFVNVGSIRFRFLLCERENHGRSTRARKKKLGMGERQGKKVTPHTPFHFFWFSSRASPSLLPLG